MGNLGEEIEELNIGDTVIITWYDFTSFRYTVVDDENGINLHRPLTYAFAHCKDTDELLRKLRENMMGNAPVIEEYTIYPKGHKKEADTK